MAVPCPVTFLPCDCGILCRVLESDEPMPEPGDKGFVPTDEELAF